MKKTIVPVVAVYREQGPTEEEFCDRAFVVLPVPKDNKWPSHQVAYFQSSGRSNASSSSSNIDRAGTWFPTVGLLFEEDDHPVQKRVQVKDINGFICKRDSLFDGLPYWCINIVRDIQLYSPRFGIVGKVATFLGDDADILPASELFLMLGSYCYRWWQVQQSAQLGGGVWHQFFKLRLFVLSFDVEDLVGGNISQRREPLDSLTVFGSSSIIVDDHLGDLLPPSDAWAVQSTLKRMGATLDTRDSTVLRALLK